MHARVDVATCIWMLELEIDVNNTAYPNEKLIMVVELGLTVALREIPIWQCTKHFPPEAKQFRMNMTEGWR